MKKHVLQKLYGSKSWFSTPWIFTGVIAITTLLTWPFSSQNPNSPMGLAFLFSSLSIAAMTGVWVAVAKPWWRFFVAIVVVLINGYLIMTCTTSRIDLLVFSVPVAISLPIALTLEAVKFLFGRFTRINRGEGKVKEGLQFGISHLLIVTTMVAGLCALGKAVLPMFETFIDYRVALSITIIVSVLVINTLISVWALMGNNVELKTMVSVVVAGVVITVGGISNPNGMATLWIVMFSVVWFINTILLTLLRLQGYRFVRKSKLATAAF